MEREQFEEVKEILEAYHPTGDIDDGDDEANEICQLFWEEEAEWVGSLLARGWIPPEEAKNYAKLGEIGTRLDQIEDKYPQGIKLAALEVAIADLKRGEMPRLRE